MAHSCGKDRSAEHGRLCKAGGLGTAAVIALLAMVLLHAMLAPGASHVPLSGRDHRATSAPAPVPPAADDCGDPAPEPSMRPAHDMGGLSAGHTGRTCGAAVGGHRSPPTVPHHLVVAALRGRHVAPAISGATLGAGGESLAIQISARTVVLRC